MSWTNSDTIQVPESYVTPKENHIRISNHPEVAKGVTPIQIIALNRPDKLGAITDEMLAALIHFFATVTVDDRVKVVIFTGTGRVFSAGIDLKADASTVKNIPVRTVRDPGGTLALAMYNCSKTIIVAYNGMSVGIGMTSTLAAAIRYGRILSVGSPETDVLAQISTRQSRVRFPVRSDWAYDGVLQLVLPAADGRLQ
jgi:enoyl-CoA hydratase/carnithine racemase